MNWRIYTAILLVIAATTAGILVATSSSDPSSDQNDAEVAPPSESGRENRNKINRLKKGPAPASNSPEFEALAARDNTPARVPARPELGESAGDAGDPPLPDEVVWDDETNQAVLGRKTWMAPVDEGQRERIDEVFEKARAARVDPRISHRDRRTSIEAVRKIVDGCYERLTARIPGIRGRLIVMWESGATQGVGTVRDVRIPTNHRLRDPEFEACIVRGAEGLTFPASDGEPRTVEYPFFYEN